MQRNTWIIIGLTLAVIGVFVFMQKEDKFAFLKQNPEVAEKLAESCLKRVMNELDEDILLEKDCFYASNIELYDNIESAEKARLEKTNVLKEPKEIKEKVISDTPKSKKEKHPIARGLQFKCTDFHRSRGTC